MNIKIISNPTKLIALTFLTILLLVPVAMNAGNDVIDRANDSYKKELYNDALKLYLSQLDSVGTSAKLCVNIGDTYYRLKDNTRAILFYERALLLDPGNEDARFNLEFVREKAQVPENAGETWLSHSFEGWVSRLSSNAWAVIALCAFLLALGAIALYLFRGDVTWRKWGFFTGIAGVIISALALLAAFHTHNKAVGGSYAIVMTDDAPLNVAPREPNDSSEVAFKLRAGAKVELLDSVATPIDSTRTDRWYNARTGDDRNAWINARHLQII